MHLTHESRHSTGHIGQRRGKGSRMVSNFQEEAPSTEVVAFVALRAIESPHARSAEVGEVAPRVACPLHPNRSSMTEAGRRHGRLASLRLEIMRPLGRYLPTLGAHVRRALLPCPLPSPCAHRRPWRSPSPAEPRVRRPCSPRHACESARACACRPRTRPRACVRRRVSVVAYPSWPIRRGYPSWRIRLSVVASPSWRRLGVRRLGVRPLRGCQRFA